MADWAAITALIILTIVAIAASYVMMKKMWEKPAGEGKPRSRRAERRARAVGLTSTTKRGIAVKGRAEKAIADYLTDNGVSYEYEPVLLGGDGRDKPMRPDFYLPDHDVYVEFWGLVDHPDGERRGEYAEKMRWKKEQYRKLGARVISLYPGDLPRLGEAFGERFEEATGGRFPGGPTS